MISRSLAMTETNVMGIVLKLYCRRDKYITLYGLGVRRSLVR
jgi:hypothetical protein